MNGINRKKSTVESKQPLVSIITASYNSAATLEQTIQSVLGQSYPHIEYIIIDGASTDGTCELIQKYARQISYWVSEPDRGIADAFNKGLRQAQGKYIGIINADDWYESQAVQEAVRVLEEKPSSDYVFGDVVYCAQDGRDLYVKPGEADYEKAIALSMPSIPHPTVFMRREAYEQHGGFSRQFAIAMDYELLLRFHKQGVAGFYHPALRAYMRIGGISDAQYMRGYAESLRIALFYGAPIISVLKVFLVKSLSTVLSRTLRKLGLLNFARRLRQQMKG